MAKSATSTNNFDPAIVNSILGKLDDYDAQLLSMRGAYMADCRRVRESMKGVYDDAKMSGIPTKPLKALMEIRKNEKKNNEIYRDKLEEEEQEQLRILAATEKVMDLPLWASARPTPVSERPRPVMEDEDPQGLRYAKFKQH